MLFVFAQKSLILLTLIMLASCVMNKNDPQPELPFAIPKDFESVTESNLIINGWLYQFEDEYLEKYVRIALQKNFDLHINAQQLNAAIANAKATNALLYPDINIGVQRSRRKNFIIDDQGSPIVQYSSEYQSDLNISWEADLWGKLNDTSRAAYLDSQVSQALYLSARLSLAANVAQTWFNLIEATNQLELSQRQLNSLTVALDIVENNYHAGINSAVDVFTAKSDLENQKALVAQSKQIIDELKRNFNILLGKYPSAHLDLSQAKIPQTLEKIPAGLPSELLLRRPDVIAARNNWLSQDYNRKAAKKNRYPSITLTGNLGVSSKNLNDLLDSDTIWILIAGITQPVFNAGRLKALEDSATAQTRQALAQYANAVLNAFREVENSLAGEKYLLRQYQTTRSAARLAKSAYDMSLEQYQSGLVEYVTVLTSQRQYFSADSKQISLYNDLVQNRINLYLALGGDFFSSTEQ